MRCPSCGAEVDGIDSATCARCGASLGSHEVEATTRLSEETLAERPASEASGGRSDDPFGPRRALYDFLYAARRSLAAGGWFEAASAAAVGFLALLCVGAAFLLAARLQYPELGSGSGPLSILISIVVLALGSLRVPVHIGDLTVTALPLGALLLTIAAVSWAVEPAIRRRAVHGLRARIAAGAKIALPFGLVCFVASFVFRFRGGATPTHAGAPTALLLGILWGALFGVVAGVRSHGTVRETLRSVARAARARRRGLYEGVGVGALMLGVAAVVACAAGLLWIIASLARGAPVSNFGAGDASAGFLYIVAFLPNLLVAIVAVGFGAPLEVGAQITIGGRQIGPLRTISLWDWGPGGAPLLAYGLVLVPVVSMIAAGYLARRRTTRAGSFIPVVTVAGIVFAAAVTVLAWLGEARLGAGIVRDHGFAVVAAAPGPLFVAALAWAWVGGSVGWKLAERKHKMLVHASATAQPPRDEAA
jgi:hypothetical protein